MSRTRVFLSFTGIAQKHTANDRSIMQSLLVHMESSARSFIHPFMRLQAKPPATQVDSPRWCRKLGRRLEKFKGKKMEWSVEGLHEEIGAMGQRYMTRPFFARQQVSLSHEPKERFFFFFFLFGMMGGLIRFSVPQSDPG